MKMFEEIEKLLKMGLTQHQAERVYLLAVEYEKPNRGRWNNNT